ERALSSADAGGATGAGAATDGAGEGPRQSPERLIEGLRLVQAELLAALRRLGVEAYCPTGERFDPAEHEAMAQHPAPGAESGTIIEVYQPGYRINGN